MKAIAKLLFAAALLIAGIGAAQAQSNPGLVQGQVPTPAQWNSYFSAKQDVLGFTPLSTAGGSMTGPLLTFPSSVNRSGFNIPPGLAPTSPNNGDIWATTAGVFVQVNGGTIGPLAGTTAGSIPLSAIQNINPGVLGYAGGGTGPVTSLTMLPTGLTLPGETFTGSSKFTGDFYATSGRPWCDPRGPPYNAVGNGSANDKAALQGCIDFLSTNFGAGVEFLAPGNYCVPGGIAISNGDIWIQGAGIVVISSCGDDTAPTITFDHALAGMLNVDVFGPQLSGGVKPTHDAVIVTINCEQCKFYYDTMYYGRYALNNNSADASFVSDAMLLSYGNAVVYNTLAVNFYRDTIDMLWPVTFPANGSVGTIANWTNGHVYAVGTLAITGGFILQVQTGGTSASVAPTVLPYDIPINDGSVVWQLVRPTDPFYGLQYDTGAGASLVYGSDFSGPYTAGIAVTNTGAAPFGPAFVVITGDDFAFLSEGILLNSGFDIEVDGGSHFGNGVGVNSAGILATGAFGGDLRVTDVTIAEIPIGIVLAAGGNNVIANSNITGATVAAIEVTSNLSTQTIVGNALGTSPTLGTNALSVVIGTGTGDNLIVQNNNIVGSPMNVGSLSGTHNNIQGTSGDGSTFSTNVGIGTESNPRYSLVVSKNATTGFLPSGLATNTELVLVGADGTSSTIALPSYATNGAALFLRADGTAASPTSVASGETIGVINFGGWNGPGSTFVANKARIAGIALDTYSNSTQGTSLEFDTTPSGSVTRAQAILLEAGVIVGPGVTDPGVANLVLGAGNAATVTAISGAQLHVVAADAVVSRLELDSFGAIAAFSGAVYGGTNGSKSAVTSGAQLVGMNSYAYNGSALVGPIVSYRTYAEENIASGHQGSEACIATTANATTTLTDGMCQHNDGGVTVASPTGGSKGSGTINALGVYINGTILGSLATLTPGTGVATALALGVNTAGGVVTSPVANANLANSSLTVGSTNIALGATSTTLAGLTSVTSTTFVGALMGHSSLDLALTGGNVSGKLGIATESNPQYPLVVSGNVTTGLAPTGLSATTNVAYFGTDATSFIESFDTWGQQGSTQFNRAEGTAASPSSLAVNSIIGGFSYGGWNGAGSTFVIGKARLVGVALDTYSNTTQGTGLEFDTTPSGSVTRAQAMMVKAGVIVGTGTTDPGVGAVSMVAEIRTGAVPTPSGSCSVNTQTGGNTAGSFKANGACVAGTVILTFANTAPTRWACRATDETTTTDTIVQTTSTSTTSTLTGTMASADVVVYNCTGF